MRVRDLKPQAEYDDSGTMLRCQDCGAQNSANAGDYFATDPAHIFACCGIPMELVVREVRYRHIIY